MQSVNRDGAKVDLYWEKPEDGKFNEQRKYKLEL